MDCDAARLFLQFRSPAARDLDDADAAGLDEHLAHCHQCHAVAAGQDRLDEHLGQAMRAVPIPDGLRERLNARLAAQRSDRLRLWFGHLARGVAAAAALLLVVWGWYYFYSPPRPRIAPDDVLISFNVARPGRDKVNDLFGQLGAGRCAPAGFNYGYLFGVPTLAVLPGYETQNIKVPQLVFTRGQQRAIVFILPEKRFRVQDLETSTHGYAYKLDVYRPGGAYAYLVFHTGDNWDWLRVTDEDH